MQTMAAQLGGTVETSRVREFGYAEVRAEGQTALLRDIHDRMDTDGKPVLDVWMSHGDKVTALPPGFQSHASNAATPNAAAWRMRRANSTACNSILKSPTPCKARPLSRGSYMIFAAPAMTGTCPTSWKKRSVEFGPKSVQDEVILGLSGGVDSSVAAALIHRAIGKQLTCVFVDNGLLRLNEAKQVMDTFSRNLGVKVIHVDAGEEFLGHLQGVSDPEKKRRIIGREFVEVFQREAAESPMPAGLPRERFIPDVIESAGSKQKRPRRSNHTIMSAVCPIRCI